MYKEAQEQSLLLQQKNKKSKEIRAKGGNRQKRSFCKTCEKPITAGSMLCIEHYAPKRKVARPTEEELNSLLKIKSQLQIGKDYGVSGNAVKRWIKSYKVAHSAGIEPTCSD